MRFVFILLLVPILLSSVEFTAPCVTYDVDIVDLDYDGDLDFVVGSLIPGVPEPPDSVNIFINNGYGEFTKTTIPKENFAYLKMIDIDCDGLLDICTKNSPDYQLVYYRNLGNLQFDEATVIPVEYTYVFQSPKFYDIDSDGDIDIVINYGGSSHSCNVLINNGDGSFLEENIVYFDNDNIIGFDIGDVNCDGFGDILITTDHNPYLLYNENFEYIFLELDLTHWGDSFFFDMDDDLDLDIILNSDLPSLSKVFFNNGEGEFTYNHTIEMPYQNVILDIKDYNNDGLADFAIQTSFDPPNVYICFNLGGGVISEPIAYTFDAIHNFVVQSADFDGNGFFDLVVTGYHLSDGIDGVSVLFNDGEGNFLSEPQVAINNEVIINNTINGISNHPNPFNPSTSICYELPININDVTIEIYNIKGQKVKHLRNQSSKFGINQVIWHGKDFNGKNVVSGIYFYRLKAINSTSKFKKMLLIN